MKHRPVFAPRTDLIQPFHVMELLGKAKALEQQGREIIHLEVGEPDFNTPQPIIDAGMQAIAGGAVHYTPSLGLPELRQAIADYYRQQFQANITADRIIVTPGASGALLLVMGALVGPHDGVMLADPGYPCNSNFVHFVAGDVQSVPVNQDTEYQLTAELIEQNWQSNTRAVLLASPSNPTGTVISRTEMDNIIALVRGKDALLIVDEIYHQLVYDIEPYTAAALDGQVIVINSFSKYFQMTGWRLGWLVLPPDMVQKCEHLSQNLFLAAPTTAQYAALAAFRPETLEILEQRRQIFKQRRDFLLPALQKLGFNIPVVPQGAFYLYADCSAFINERAKDSMALCLDILEHAGVAITPGVDFGNNQPEKYLRFSYTRDIVLLERAVDKLRQYLGGSY